MKTLFVGAGAIGSLVGAYMARGGAEVTLFDIADHIHTIAKEGLKVRTIGGDSFAVKVKAVSDAKTINDIDLLILTVKTFHTESALASVAHLKNRIMLSLSIQNGVEKEDHLTRFWKRESRRGHVS
jgi:2-dehydropantoate 2-reductase